VLGISLLSSSLSAERTNVQVSFSAGFKSDDGSSIELISIAVSSSAATYNRFLKEDTEEEKQEEIDEAAEEAAEEELEQEEEEQELDEEQQEQPEEGIVEEEE